MKRLVLLLVLSLLFLASCGTSKNTQPTTDGPSTTITASSDDNQITQEDETVNMKLKIDGIEVDVIWADNNSVKALKNLAKDGLTIDISKYGGFERKI